MRPSWPGFPAIHVLGEKPARKRGCPDKRGIDGHFSNSSAFQRRRLLFREFGFFGGPVNRNASPAMFDLFSHNPLVVLSLQAITMGLPRRCHGMEITRPLHLLFDQRASSRLLALICCISAGYPMRRSSPGLPGDPDFLAWSKNIEVAGTAGHDRKRTPAKVPPLLPRRRRRHRPPTSGSATPYEPDEADRPERDVEVPPWSPPPRRMRQRGGAQHDAPPATPARCPSAGAC